MAVSPAGPYGPSDSSAAATAKVKALTILDNKSPKAAPPAGSVAMAHEPQRDITDIFNDEVRRRYVKTHKLGEGTYATVHAAHLASDPTQRFAIKKIKVNNQLGNGMAVDAIREIKCLTELEHDNIIKLHAVFSSKNQNLNLVLELLPLGDLEEVLKARDHLEYNAADIKSWMAMSCRGLAWCHANFIMHRDIKQSNLLIAADGTIKLADFGLARHFDNPQVPMTHEVITRWYRPPELLLGANQYSPVIDVWSIGVVMGELVMRSFWLIGQTDIDMLDRIAQVCGPLNEDTWPSISRLPLSAAITSQNGQHQQQQQQHRGWSKAEWEMRFGLIGPVGVDLLRKMLVPDPRHRLSSRAVLEHAWWTTDPRPTPPHLLPRDPRKLGGEAKVGDDLKRRGGELPTEGRADKVARKINFGDAR
ncbi:putative serine/threonine protein kinase [Saccharata proteae CBS 121410]|uniref:Serine/threonine protein kinase n=1 Tax=Saccharata proteae CBS 121410 TaxID=1314787 RepID=A0A9P4HM73_9PEZI|nr:putative serine/threonine protein kinase [Saccharata proteae CBS 121410]